MEQVHVGEQGGKPATEVKALVGPLTLRDTVVVAGAILVLVGSLVPIPWTKTVSVNMWIFPGLPFHLLVSLLLPLGVGAGFAWRRLTQRTKVRVGSLSLDQFGSVVAMISGAYFFNSYAATTSPAYLIGLFGAIAMLLGTTLARYFGNFRKDFVPGGDSVITADVRPVAIAHPAAADASPVTEDSAEGFGASSARSTPSSSSAPKSSIPVNDASKPVEKTVSPGGPSAAAASALATLGAPSAAETPGKSSTARETATEDSKESAPETTGTPLDTAEDAAAVAGPVTADSKDNSAAVSAETSDAGSNAGNASAGKAEAVAKEPAASPETGLETEPKPESKASEEPKESGGTEFPEINLNQQESVIGKAAGNDSDAAPTGLIQAATPAKAQDAPPANVQTPKLAQSPEPATSATPVAPGGHQATAALSREELATQLAAAANQKAKDDEPFGARADAVEPEPASNSFWFALNQARPVYDPRSGAVMTTLQPGVWILCLEDRGTEYLINLDGDRPAILRELGNLQFPDN